MSKIYTLIGITGFYLLIAGCKTASKLYDKGNYDEAVELAVKKIQKKPNDNEMKSLLQNAYHYAVNGHETRIRQLSDNTNELKWEWVYNEYACLQKLYDAVYRSPEASRIVDATDYSSYLNTYSDKAADIRLQRGLQWMEKDDKQSYRNAYNELNAALRFRPADFTLQEKREEAYKLALVHVVVMPMGNYRFRFSSYNNNESGNFENELLQQLKYHSGNQFVKFYNAWEAENRGIQADQYIDFRFSTLNLGRNMDENSTREVSKEVVVKETVYRPDSVVKEYRKVFAKITTTKRTMRSDGSLQITIRDANGHRIWSDNVSGNHCWTTEFVSFTGDERALSENDKNLVNRQRLYPPHEDEIIRQIMNEISSNLQTRIRNYYNRF